MEVKDAFQSYILDCESRGLSPNTMRVYKQRLRHFHGFLVQRGVSNIERLTADHLRMFTAEVRQRDIHQFTNHHSSGQLVGSRTVFHYCRLIKTFGTWLVEQEILDRSPFSKVKLPRVEKKLMPALTLDEITTIYNVILHTGGENATRDLAIYCFCLESGARVTEVVELILDNLYLDNFTAKVHGKGSKERIVCYTEKTANLLKRYLAERPQVSHGEVFLSLRNGKPLAPHAVRLLLRKYGKRAGIHCYPHLLRHTFATRYLVNGDEKNLISLQKLMGHATLDMVRQYVNMLPIDVEKQYKKYSPLKGLVLEEPAMAGGKK